MQGVLGTKRGDEERKRKDDATRDHVQPPRVRLTIETIVQFVK